MEAKIDLRGPIGMLGDGMTAEEFRGILQEFSGRDVTINLSSEGGVVTEGLEMYTAIAEHDGQTTVVIDAVAASIATVVALAADRVEMNSHGIFMIHRCWTAAVGNAIDFRKTADIMEMLDGQIADIYAEKTGLETGPILDMMSEEKWMDATEAFNMGFVDGVNDVKKAEPEAAIRASKKYRNLATMAGWIAKLP